jgi:hypothetical protein
MRKCHYDYLSNIDMIITFNDPIYINIEIYSLLITHVQIFETIFSSALESYIENDDKYLSKIGDPKELKNIVKLLNQIEIK